MLRRFFSRIALGLPREVQTLSPPQRVVVLILVFVFYVVLTAQGLAPTMAIGVVLVLGVVTSKIVALLNADDVPGPADA